MAASVQSNHRQLHFRQLLLLRLLTVAEAENVCLAVEGKREEVFEEDSEKQAKIELIENTAQRWKMKG